MRTTYSGVRSVLGIMPKPFPDELLYSFLARTRSYLGVQPSRWKKGLFGREVWDQIDLPGHLEELVALFPPGNTLTADDLIDCHTLLPFHAAFTEPHRVSQVRGKMLRTPPGGRYFGLFGEQQDRISARLRFCPACAKDDIRLYGEPYWHRLHQLSCVIVCPEHAMFLEDSPVRTDVDRHSYLAAADNLPLDEITPRVVEPLHRTHIVWMEIAQDAQWILNNVDLGTEAAPIRSFYLHELQGKRLATSRVDWNRVAHTLMSHYPLDALQQVGCPITVDMTSERLSRLCIQPYAKSPVWHLLLIRFLGYTAQEFFNRLQESRHPFLGGPWPCLNPMAAHFRETIITECAIEFIGGRARGSFQCKCGFHYRRYGPDQSREDHLRFDRVSSYGPVWEQALRSLWEDPNVSLDEIANQFGIDRKTLVRRSRQLGLPSRDARKGSPKETVRTFLADSTRASRFQELWVKPGMSVELLCTQMGISRHLAKACAKKLGLDVEVLIPRSTLPWPKENLEGCRAVWMNHIRNHPGAPRSYFMLTATGLYRHLKKHDPQWLEQTLPKPMSNMSAVDWPARDQFLSTEVSSAALRIRNRPGIPIEVSRASLSRKLGTNLRKSNSGTLPLTEAAVLREIDSPTSILIRRLWWTAEQYRQKGKVPTRAQLKTNSSAFAHPEVQAVLKEILASFGSPTA